MTTLTILSTEAALWRELLKARTMIELGCKDPMWQAVVDSFEMKVRQMAEGMK
jgi:hypothetical protein